MTLGGPISSATTEFLALLEGALGFILGAPFPFNPSNNHLSPFSAKDDDIGLYTLGRWIYDSVYPPSKNDGTDMRWILRDPQNLTSLSEVDLR